LVKPMESSQWGGHVSLLLRVTLPITTGHVRRHGNKRKTQIENLDPGLCKSRAVSLGCETKPKPPVPGAMSETNLPITGHQCDKKLIDKKSSP